MTYFSSKSCQNFIKENGFGLVWFRGLTPQQQPGSYQGGEMMMKSVFWWRKPEHPEETTDLRQVTDERKWEYIGGGEKEARELQFTLCKEIRHVFTKMVPCSRPSFLYDDVPQCRAYIIYKRSTPHVTE